MFWPAIGLELCTPALQGLAILHKNMINLASKMLMNDFRQHQAAVKAVSWCPWQPGVLATGGGTADKTIKIWNINSGSLINSVDTKSQVDKLVWIHRLQKRPRSDRIANHEEGFLVLDYRPQFVLSGARVDNNLSY
jgi:WD40 repeat protein